jgi:hypothetical protein
MQLHEICLVKIEHSLRDTPGFLMPACHVPVLWITGRPKLRRFLIGLSILPVSRSPQCL